MTPREQADAEPSDREDVNGGTSDQEALVDVPLSFELSGFEPVQFANRGVCMSGKLADLIWPNLATVSCLHRQ